jgi:electron transfer flavoprotein alpha subunit
VLIEPGRPRVDWELLGVAARLAREIGGRVTAVAVCASAQDIPPDAEELSRRGADELLVLQGAPAAADVASGLAAWCETTTPWAVLVAGTMWGREVASRAGARLGAGLVGDAIELTVDAGRLVAWKPAFGGKVVAAIESSSPTQLVTVRPGVIGLAPARAGGELQITVLTVRPDLRTRLVSSVTEDEMDELSAAACVIGVGRGVSPDEYVQLDPLRRVLGAELAATRKVTDVGWLPRARQLGITGRSIAPQLYIAIGMSGKFNHMAGVRRSTRILAINSDPEAAVFSCSDIGIVGDWREIVPLLAASFEAELTP